MANYLYDELPPSVFESLIVEICSAALLGKGVTGFADGPDGGRDAKFEGVTNGFPSDFSPWKGITIVQAKHTNKVEGSFSDGDFFSNKSSTLNEEMPRIAKLVETHQLDHYVIFANRKLTGGVEQKIKDRISTNCHLATADIQVYGVEKIDSILRQYPRIVTQYGLDTLAAPLRVTRDALAQVITAMSDTLRKTPENVFSEPTPRVSLKKKNSINEVSDEDIAPLRKRYLKYAQEIDSFLSDPINEKLVDKYNEAVDELNDRWPELIRTRDGFMGAWYSVYDILTSNDETLRNNSRLLRAIQFYMYWNCDLGKSDENASPE
jgi:hypothetical protein